MPSTRNKPRIYICQAGTCRSKGADAALIEIEELVKLVEDCDVEETGCMGYCRQGPVVAVRTKEQMRSRKLDNATYHVRVNTFKKSVKIVEKATGENVQLENLPPESESRLSEIRAEKRREYFTSTFQWNKALSGLLTDPVRNHEKLYSDYQQILSKAGYPDMNPLNLLRPSIRDRFDSMEMPYKIENYVPWILKSVEVVSKHSAIFRFKTKDLKRGTPHPRGGGKMVSPVTWHVTMLGEVGENEEGPLPWIERDYTPISSALDWERGTCDILIKIYNDGNLTSWLRDAAPPHPCSDINPRRIWLSKPIKTLSVPTLSLEEDEGFKPASLLLLLAGTGIVALPQILAHRDPTYKLGVSTPRSAQLFRCPVDLIQSCRADDILLLPEIKEYCLEWTEMKNIRRGLKGLRSCTLLLTDVKQGDEASSAPYHKTFDAEKDVIGNCDNVLKDIPNAKVLKSQRLNGDIVSDAIEKLSEPYRIIVSGPDTFNNAVKKYLDSCEVDPTWVTMLSA